eukprot:c13552_g1_i2.p1 GENE.c13552_g1_i2~~c13552_g1_i2.p1  ORF type:complete len:327 (+),score=75.18 c13552_g1_i2:27-983(+)
MVKVGLLFVAFVCCAAAPLETSLDGIQPEPQVEAVSNIQSEKSVLPLTPVSDVPVEPFQPHPLERAFFANETRVPWSYDAESPIGPEYWATLDKSFKACADTSKSQSPMDLFQFRIASPMSPLLTPQFNTGEMMLRNTGNYLRLIPHKGSLLFWGDKVFELVYASVHTPSDHHMAGESFPVEIQFVHKSIDANDDQLAVLSLLYKLGLPNAFIDRVLEVAPTEGGAEAMLGGAVNLGDVIPRDITQYKSGTRISYPHYSYDGSLASPPCRENVRWFVWSKPDQMSKHQVDGLRRLFKSPSARPLQSVNGRAVEFKTLF